MNVIEFLQGNTTLSLFLIILLGTLIGNLSIRGVSLGASGVLFVALVFGHFGIAIPGAITTLGVALFVYAVGLQAGPRFFKAFRSRGIAFAMLAIVTLAAGFAATVAMEMIFHFGAALSTGLYTGSLTTTPGLAAALEALKDPNVSVGYGVAYPFGVVGVVLFVQLMPRFLRIDLKKEAKEVERKMKGPGVKVVWLEMKNPQLHGKTVDELSSAHLTTTAISRITKLGHTIPARNEAELQLGDRVRAIGTDDNLHKLEMLIGPQIENVEEPPSNIVSHTLIVSEDAVAGKRLDELHIRERYGIVVTRLWRDEIEMVPTGSSTLEFGDTIRIVGDSADCQRFMPLVGHQERRLQETRFLPLSLGLAVGVAIGLIPLPFPGELRVALGMAGGPLFAALIVGHFGRIGPLSFRMPLAAKIFIREMGLIFFLAGAGTKAGANFVEVLKAQGVQLFIAGVVIAAVPLAASYIFARWVLKLDILSTLGAICGGMTSTPGLGVASNAADSDVPAVAYATVYPVALILVTILSQILGLALKALGGT
ncbi:YidE/YbjL duplication [bacterium]|nr:YidE/YbjL duplication [bacterium]